MYAQEMSKENGTISSMIQGCETVKFRSKFLSWTHTDPAIAAEEGRPKFAGLIRLDRSQSVYTGL